MRRADVQAYEAEHGPIAPDTDELIGTSDAFLELADNHPSPKVRRHAINARAAMDKVRAAMTDWDLEKAARDEADRAKKAALADIRKAEEALAAAKAKAREVGASRAPRSDGGKPRDARGPASPQALANRRTGLIRSGHERGLHTRTANPNCPTCTEEAGGGLADAV